jgi:hypothetical protein
VNCPGITRHTDWCRQPHVHLVTKGPDEEDEE